MLPSEVVTPEGGSSPFSNANAARAAKLAEIDANYKKQHAGHEQAHFYMILIMFFFVFGFQLLVITWKRRHYASYQTVSLAGYFRPSFSNSMPPIGSLYQYGVYSQFLTAGVGFIDLIISEFLVISRASQRPLHHLTPRLIYKWFSVTHHISFVVGVIGYVSMMTLMFLIPPPEAEDDNASISIPFLFLLYGLYFGLLSRDFAELCSNRMAATLGFYKKDGLPSKQLRDNICAICGGFLLEARHNDTHNEQEPIHTLNCTHTFHEKCLRGWCIVGKKDTCPYCHEKVSLKSLARNPWDTQQELYLSLLDYLRYLIVWVPIISMVITGSYKILHLD